MKLAEITTGDSGSTLSVMEFKTIKIKPGKAECELLEQLGPGWEFVGKWRDIAYAKTTTWYRRTGKPEMWSV
jgi:hypothetical protein